MTPLSYLCGFGNEHATESLSGALPQGQNSPQRCPYGLYAEQLSGSAFTAPREHNLRSWLYRVRPSVLHRAESKLSDSTYAPRWQSAPCPVAQQSIGPRRWAPLPLLGSPNESAQAITFIEGIHSYTLAGSVDQSGGMGAHLYVMNAAMRSLEGREQYLINADAELLILPQHGALEVKTELGFLRVEPTELVVIPRGVLFQVNPLDSVSPSCRGYICENYGAPFELPNLGPIGANCLAYPRDFLYPVAQLPVEELLDQASEIFTRWGGRLYHAKIPYSPLDVVAWHGNYAPYKYDLKRFCTIGSISFDHPDPSIFTVLTSPSLSPGVANVDFVIFPDRWLVAEHSFRPPWFHRNIMSEFMGLITGVYDAKEEGFAPGGASLHNLMIPHGPDAFGFAKASSTNLEPQKLSGTLAFMFETRLPQHPTVFAQETSLLDEKYDQCWGDLRRYFNGGTDPQAES